MYLVCAGYLHYIKTASNHTTGTGEHQEISFLWHAWLGMHGDIVKKKEKKRFMCKKQFRWNCWRSPCMMQHHTQAHTHTFLPGGDELRALSFKWKSMEAANLYLSAASLHNTSKDSSTTSLCQEDVNPSLFMWERDECKTETTTERLEINSTCVCACVWCSNFSSLQLFSVACEQGGVHLFNAYVQHRLTALCYNTQWTC